MEKKEVGLVNSIGYLLNKAALYFKINALQIFKENNFSITLEQFGILCILNRDNGIYQRQLAKMSLKDRPNITRLIDILEEKGFVYRETDPNNKRIYKVFITENGKKQVEQIRPFLMNLHNKAINKISDEQHDSLKAILGQICENLDEDFKLQM